MNASRRAAAVAGLVLGFATSSWADPTGGLVRSRGRTGNAAAAVTPEDGKPLYPQDDVRLEDRRGARQLLFSADGRTLLTAGGDDLTFWDVSGRASVRGPTFTGDTLGVGRGGFEAVAWSPDGKLLAVGGRDRSVHLIRVAQPAGGGWELTPLSDVAEHDAAVTSLAFNSAGNLLLSGGEDNAIYLWGVANGKLQEQGIVKLTRAMFGVKRLAFYPKGSSFVAACGDGNLRVLDVVGRGSVAPRGEYRFPATFDLPIAISPTSGTVAIGSNDDVQMLARTGVAAAYHGHAGNITGTAWTPDGRALASVGEDGKLLVWDANGHVRYHFLRPRKFTAVAFSPAAGPIRVAAANENGTTYLFRLADAPAPGTAAAAAAPADGAPAAAADHGEAQGPAGAAAPAPPAVAADGDAQQIVGDWELVADEHRGTALSPDALRRAATTLTITPTKWIELVGTTARTADYKLTPAADPKLLDLHYHEAAGKRTDRFGVYRLDGDTLTTCVDVRTDGGGGRPTELKATRTTDVLTFRRVAPAK